MNIIIAAVMLIHGQITAINGSVLTLKTCDGTMTVDASTAVKNQKTVPLVVGKYVGMTADNGNALTIWNKKIGCPS